MAREEIRYKHCPACGTTHGVSRTTCPDCGGPLADGEAPVKHITGSQRRLLRIALVIIGALFGLMFGARMNLYHDPVTGLFSAALLAACGAIFTLLMGRLFER